MVHGIARGVADRDIEAFKAKDIKAFYKAKGAKEILDSVDTDLCYVPAADVQPVKHGRWIDIYEYCKALDLRPTGLQEYYWCSECDKAEKKTSDFCPNCGARMDSDNGDTNG